MCKIFRDPETYVDVVVVMNIELLEEDADEDEVAESAGEILVAVDAVEVVEVETSVVVL